MLHKYRVQDLSGYFTERSFSKHQHNVKQKHFFAFNNLANDILKYFVSFAFSYALLFKSIIHEK